MSSKYNRLFKDTLIFGIGSFGSKLLLFLLVPIYTNYMTAAEYGIADLVFSLSQLVAPFLSIVIFDAVTRFGLSKDQKPEEVLLAGYVVLFFSTVAGLLLIPLLDLYGAVGQWKWYLYFYLIFGFYSSLEHCFLKAIDRNKTYALIGIFQTAVMASLNILFLVYLHMGVQGYLLACILANFFSAVITYFVADCYTYLKTAKLNLPLLKQMCYYSAPLILNNISWWAIHSSNKVMIEMYVGISALGIYTVAAKIPALINVFVTIFQQAWGISAIKEIESSNDKSFYSIVFKYYVLFTSCACLFFVSLVKYLMPYYVGKEFVSAWQYIPLLLVSAVYAAVASFYGSMYGALMLSKNNMLTTVLSAIVNVVFNYFFMIRYGLWGAVIGTYAAYFVLANIRMFDVLRHISIKVEWFSYFINFLIISAHALAVSLDFYGGIASLLAVATFVYFNFSQLIDMIRMIERRRKKHA